MNSYKLNGIAGHACRAAICESLKIRHVDIYEALWRPYQLKEKKKKHGLF